MMVNVGPVNGQIQITDDSSYDYIVLSFESNETKSIKLDPQMRNQTNRLCGNGSYALKGGNGNCTLYVGI